ncbi:ATP-binding cassette domain-containing protein [Allokutzneria oryzae]|uniref:ATP-binding cassette domain-containing protein n=1 Tax=Allokutzneria oryzae TaxID=1378989 RepID=A0ABV6A878_9PSEU
MTELMIDAVRITKKFAKMTALDGVDLQVPKGTVMGLLGHNGAGKTTLVNILSTLSTPTSGTARVAGYDVLTHGHDVRGRIGLTGQFASVDEQITGMDNLVLIARLLGAGKREARQRAEELLEVFDLTAAGGRKAQTYSGGMRRRLDLAASLVGHPDVIFLDEPTTGLDPSSRNSLWEIVERLVREGTTVLLTTQYLEEADRLADRITVLASGRIVAAGTADELKGDIGTRTIMLTLAHPGDVTVAMDALRRAGLHPSHDVTRRKISSPAAASTDLILAVRALDRAGVMVTELGMSEPSLDDVYLALNHDPKADIENANAVTQIIKAISAA